MSPEATWSLNSLPRAVYNREVAERTGTEFHSQVPPLAAAVTLAPGVIPSMVEPSSNSEQLAVWSDGDWLTDEADSFDFDALLNELAEDVTQRPGDR
ncbi:MAG: hypothetical protein ACKPEY_12010 [Planctomycetota bacterium]